MNVLFISQCQKRALSETRRILDQFAERRGDGTWQTPITQAGLDTVRRLLRKTARRNTAVACHWIRGKDHSELLWVVGDASRFNAQGAVPTQTTRRDVLRQKDENDWHNLNAIRLLAQLAALLHDLGKASLAFQQRLRGERSERNRYRHEWVSLRLFQAFVGQDDDTGWLQRLADVDNRDEQLWLAPERYQRDGLDQNLSRPFQQLPPLAAAIAWLVVSHHRLPVVPVRNDDGAQAWLGKRARSFNLSWLETPLALVEHDWNEIHQPADAAHILPYWTPAGPLPITQTKWRMQAARFAKALLELQSVEAPVWLDNPYVMHLARLSLMLADHHYSSLPPDSTQRVRGDGHTQLYANTDADGALKQPLDEHLLGVARDAGLITHALPGFERYLPRLAHHRGLRKRSQDPRFSWQDKAADAAMALREEARKQGAFIVNMASTGCGKTLANARILYALADPRQGMRMTYALGLRTLTLQTGRSYRTDLQLNDDELAIRVGGSASRSLFEYYEQKAEAQGSASQQALIEEDSHVLYEGVVTDHPLLSRALHHPDIRNLLSAPILVCTVDHLVPATESLRAGRQIAPMLRLLSGDLILDELDDYDLNDLPALTRLVHWAGMLGTRVVLSSATLPPSLIEGMYLAYQAGRSHYQRNRGEGRLRSSAAEIPCLWVDEFATHTAQCSDALTFVQQHQAFIAKRVTKLKAAEPLRRAELVPLDIAKNQPKSQIRHGFTQAIRAACLQLHTDHAEADPVSGKRVSLGIVRMANIDPLFEVAQQLLRLGSADNTRIHLCVYHARFPLILRSAIENQLDTAFNRRGDAASLYQQPAIRAALDAYPEQNHLFVVLASPVCEVGRDWDADWAIAEPSSMRALIQLAGRVQRHRRRVGTAPNLLILDRNLKAFEATKLSNGDPAPVFVRPGFERDDSDRRFRLRYQKLSRLLAASEYQILTAIPRIQPRPEIEWASQERLVDLEHGRLATGMLPRQRLPLALAPKAGAAMERDESAWCWQYPQASLTGILPQQQPFREDNLTQTTLLFLPDEDEEKLILHRLEQAPANRQQKLHVPIGQSQHHRLRSVFGERIGFWGGFDLMALLAEQATALELPLAICAQRLTTVEVPESEQGWWFHPALGFSKKQ